VRRNAAWGRAALLGGGGESEAGLGCLAAGLRAKAKQVMSPPRTLKEGSAK